MPKKIQMKLYNNKNPILEYNRNTLLQQRNFSSMQLNYVNISRPRILLQIKGSKHCGSCSGK